MHAHRDDLLGDHSDSGWCVWQLFDSADDRARRYGVSDIEHAQLLVYVAGLFLLRCELFRRWGRAAAGWTSYPGAQRAARCFAGSHMGQTLWLMGLTFVGISSMMGSVNYMTTIIQMRAPGMTMFRMPLTIWAMFITAVLQAFALAGSHSSWFHAVDGSRAWNRILHS